MQRTDGPGDSALAGYLTLPLTSLPADRFTPDTVINQPLTDDLSLLGYSAGTPVDAPDWQPGAPLRLDLIWTANVGSEKMAADTPIQVFLDGGESVPLWEGNVADGAIWDDGEAICRRLRLRLPLETTPGDYSLSVASGDSTIALGDVTIAEWTRQFGGALAANRDPKRDDLWRSDMACRLRQYHQ